MSSHDLSLMASIVVLLVLVSTFIMIFEIDVNNDFTVVGDYSSEKNLSNWSVPGTLNVEWINASTTFPGGYLGKGVALFALGIGLVAMAVITGGLAIPVIPVIAGAIGVGFGGLGVGTIVQTTGAMDVPLVSEFWGGVNYLSTITGFLQHVLTFSIPESYMPVEIGIFVSAIVTIPVVFVFAFVVVKVIRGMG